MTAKLLKYIPYPIIVRLYYYYFRRKKDSFLRTLKKDKYQILSDLPDLKKYKKSKKLFVIGSGYSINNLTKEDWAEINNHDTFGFNFSFLNNDHVPTYYACEAIAPKSCNQYGRSDVAEIFYQLYKKKSEKYKGVLKILTDLHKDRKEHFENYGRDMFDEKFYVLKTVNGIAQTQKQFNTLINYYEKKGIFDEKETIEEIFKFRATLSMAISFGINMGYTEIILCGIDLTDPRYFYQDTQKYPEVPPAFQSSPLKKSHTTSFDTPNMISIVSALKSLNILILKNRCKLFVMNPNSALAEFLPIYKF